MNFIVLPKGNTTLGTNKKESISLKHDQIERFNTSSVTGN